MLALKGVYNFSKSIFIKCILVFFNNISRSVLRCCFRAECYFRCVAFSFRHNIIRQFRSLPDAYRQNSFRVRVKRSRMAYFFYIKRFSYYRNNVMRSIAFFFVNIYYPVQHYTSKAFLSSLITGGITSSKLP